MSSRRGFPSRAAGLALLAFLAVASSSVSQPARKIVVAPPKSIAEAVQAPMSMSDPDGQDLVLEQLDSRVAVHGMLSLTELEFRFRNPRNARVEGRFSCTLPPDAAISRFAKEVNGQLMEGEVVERLRANQVYEQFLHQMRDPALLEQDQGNRFSARIFPIEANATVRLVLSYSQLLPMRGGVRTYSLPIRGLAHVGRFSFRAVVSPLGGETASAPDENGMRRSTSEVLTREERDFTPEADIVLNWRAAADAPRARVLRAGDFYIASFRPDAAPSNHAAPSSWLLYVDTSASAADGAEHRIRALERMLAALPPDARLEVRAFDIGVVPLLSGPAAEVAKQIGAAMRARIFAGGTDVEALLRDVGKAAAADHGRAIVVASDLVATLGNTDAKALADLVRALPAGARIDVLTLGSRTNAAFARSLTAGRGRAVDLPFTNALDARAALAARELLRPVGATVDVTDGGADWFYPSRLYDVGTGDEVLVLGRAKGDAPPAPSAAGLSTKEVEPLQSSAFAPLLEREAYRAYIAYLAARATSEENAAVRQALETEQVRVSVAQRVVIPQTTMLVLETEFDYQRFGLDRRALADILTIDASGITKIDRRANPPAIAEVPPPPPMPRPVSGGRKAAADTRANAGMSEAITVTRPVPKEAAKEVDADEEEDRAPEPAGSIGPRSEAVTVTSASPITNRAPSPMPAPPPLVTPAPERRESAVSESITVQKRRPADWTKPDVPDKARIAELQAQLKQAPNDRESYNALSEAYSAAGEWPSLRGLVLRWQPFDPENPQVYELLGLAAEKLGRKDEAVRAYASLVELAPAKTELLQRAGLLLVRVGRSSLAEAPLRRALELRPDRVNGYRHLALMLMMDGRSDEAARVLESATKQTFPNWYGDAQRVIREELAYAYRAMLAAQPERRAEIEERAKNYAVDLVRQDALRVTLAWETDANDVDLHVVDPNGEECFYSHTRTESGLELYQDITQGLGPEVIRTRVAKKGRYYVGVNYFSSGPMGVSRGIAVVYRKTGGAPDVTILPFRLVNGGRDMRRLAAVDVQ